MSLDFDAVVIGAGFGGMYMLHRLRQKGFRVRVFESGKGVGGTWYWNRYPGARCDVESVQYSYQFSPELQQEWEWTERYATQPEILRYANHVADRFDLRRDIQFETRVTQARFDEKAHAWTVETDKGDCVTARFVITAMGCLSSPNTPKIPGLEDFKGPTYHTGNWPHEGVDFTGKTVGVIGTGSSAIQSIPIIAQQASHLTVFQRTANYMVPAHNKPLDPAYVSEVKADYEAMRRRAKKMPAGIDFAFNPASAIETDEAERRRLFEERWNYGGLGFMGSFSDLLLNAESNRTAADFVRAKIREVVKDPELADKVDSDQRHRLQAAVRRYRLLGDLQPAACDAGRCERRADRAHHGRRLAGQGQGLHVRLPGAGHRLRRHDRRAAAGRLSRPRRRLAAGQVEGGAEILSRPHHGGLPQPLHHHRSGQPLGADQHAAVDRAARRMDRRLHRLHARTRRHVDRAPIRRPRRPGSAMSARRPAARCARPAARGMSAPTSPASRACSCLISAASRPTSNAAKPW